MSISPKSINTAEEYKELVEKFSFLVEKEIRRNGAWENFLPASRPEIPPPTRQRGSEQSFLFPFIRILGGARKIKIAKKVFL